MQEEGTETPEQGKEAEVPGEKKEAPKVVEEPKEDGALDIPEATLPEVPAEPEKKAEPPKKIKLDSAAGSEVHLAQLNLLNMNSGVKQTQLELANAEAQVSHLREKLSWEVARLNQERDKVLAVLSNHGVPDGWRFNRQKDGSYVFTPPAPALPPRPPMG